MKGVDSNIDGLNDDDYSVDQIRTATVESDIGKGVKIEGELRVDVALEDVRVSADVYNKDGDDIGDATALSESALENTGTDISAGETKAFVIGYGTSDPSVVSSFKLILNGYLEESPTPTGTAESTATETDSETETNTETETETPTPEPVDISFEDDWEDGNFTDPRWITYGGDYNIVDDSGPEGGSKSFNVSGNSLTQETFRFDAPWVLEGAIKIPAFAQTAARGSWGLGAINISAEDNYSQDVTISLNKDKQSASGGYSINVPGGDRRPSRDIVWETEIWYRFEVTHDGDGVYSLSLWAAEDEKPATAQIEVEGSPASGPDSEKAIGIGGYSGAAEGANYAFISFISNRDLMEEE
jgi:hypothetical protein